MSTASTRGPAASQDAHAAAAPAPAVRRLRAERAVLRAEARLFLREPAANFWIFFFPTLLVVILGLIPAFREPQDSLGGLRVIDQYVPVGVLLAMITTGVQSMPPVLGNYRERGILRRLAVTPVRPGAVLGAQIVLHAVAAICSAFLAVAVGRLAYGVDLPRQAAGYLLALVLCVAAALALGSAITSVSSNIKITQAVGSAVFFPMMFTAGVWLPVAAMPDLLRRIVEWTPFGAGAQALNQAAAGHWPDWSHLGVTTLWAVLLLAGAVRWFRWE